MKSEMYGRNRKYENNKFTTLQNSQHAVTVSEFVMDTGINLVTVLKGKIEESFKTLDSKEKDYKTKCCSGCDRSFRGETARGFTRLGEYN